MTLALKKKTWYGWRWRIHDRVSYLDRVSYVPAVYPASLLYHKCRYHHSEKGTYRICIMKILLILWTPWKVLEESTVHTLRIAVIQGVWTSTVNKVLRKAFLRKWFLSQAKGTIAHMKALKWAKLYVSSRKCKETSTHKVLWSRGEEFKKGLVHLRL